MAKEPKLFAEIRENKARVEKAAKEASPPPVGPIMSASVVTPDVPRVPNNYIATTLDECTTVEHCQTLLAHAKAAGYADDGRVAQLIRAKIEGLRQGTHHTVLTTEALHAASVWGQPFPEIPSTPPPPPKPSTRKASKRGRR